MKFILIRVVVWFFPITLAFAAGPGGGTNSQAPGLVFLGDSLTAGYGLDASEAFPALIDQRLRKESLNFRVVNAGVSGDTTAGGLRRLSWLLKQAPTYVVVALGANDMLRGIDPKETEKNLDEILTRIQATGARAILLGMKATPNLGSKYREQYDGIYPRLAKKHATPYLEFFLKSVALKASLNQPDGVHPTAEGTKLIAKDVGDFLLPLLKEKHK